MKISHLKNALHRLEEESLIDHRTNLYPHEFLGVYFYGAKEDLSAYHRLEDEGLIILEELPEQVRVYIGAM